MRTELSNMYKHAKTWSPFKGCGFNCSYCSPSFQKQAKRQKHLCQKCYDFVPHEHPERLIRIPSAKIVFVAGNGDISYCDPDFTWEILDAIKKHNLRCPYKTYYLQSKCPEYFEQFLFGLPENIVLVTTLETNRDEGYGDVSKAPPPSARYEQFSLLDHPRKVITAEPLMDFDLWKYATWITDLNPEYIWLGYNSRPNQVKIPEPPKLKLMGLIDWLQSDGIEIRGKTLRGVVIP